MIKPCIIGNKYGKWKVLEEIPNNGVHDRCFNCICECGITKVVRYYQLISGRSKQCRSCARTKHGFHKSRTYIIWQGIIQRCLNPNNKHYKYYGGRGITICDTWKSFDLFLGDMGTIPDKLEVDRIDNNGMYNKNNCRIVDKITNMNNRRCSKKDI